MCCDASTRWSLGHRVGCHWRVAGSTQSKGTCFTSSCSGAVYDLGRIANIAVSLAAPDTNVIVLVGEVELGVLLGLGVGSFGGVPVKTSKLSLKKKNSIKGPERRGLISSSFCVILETVLLRSHEVATLVLSHSDVPGPTG